MEDWDEASGDGVSEELLERLRDAGGGSSFVDEILDTPGIGGQYGGVDGRAALIAIMRNLVILTGSEADAVSWLFHSRGYTPLAGSDAYLALENGDFWSLTVLDDWLKILVTYQAECPMLIDRIFRDSDS